MTYTCTSSYDRELFSKQVFMQYTNSSPVFSKGLPHPADVVEAASLAVSELLPF